MERNLDGGEQAAESTSRPSASSSAGRISGRASTGRLTVYLWLFVLCAAVDIYIRAAELVRAGLLVAAAVFLGLFSYELINRLAADPRQDAP